VSLPPAAGRIEKNALILGAAALLVSLVTVASQQFSRSYLLAYLFWLSIPLGSAALLMLYHLTGGNWGYVIRRMLEAATRTLPMMAVLFLPLLWNPKQLYEWADPAKVAADELLQHKQPYLNVPFFIGRAVFYFLIWIGLSRLLSRWSAEQDESGDPAPARRLLAMSGPGLIVLGFTVTFAVIDWVMSLEPHWASTIYGLWFIVGMVLTTLSFMVFTARRFALTAPMDKVLQPSHFHDLGNLMLAFTMLWAYTSFSQFLIIWSGNLPEETTFYVKRMGEGWQTIAAVLVLFHFALPFLVLLSRDIKTKMERLATLAIGMLIMRMVDLFWIIRPAFGGAPSLHWQDVTLPLAIGGLWVWMFLRQLKVRPMMPAYNPQGDPAF
jgi:hypothetical protein